MGKNFILTVSKIISEEVNGKSTISEINFAVKEIEKLIITERVRESLTREEIEKKKINGYISLFDLKEYLEQIEENIFKLENFLDILNTKKRLMEFKTKKSIIPMNLVTLQI